ncbi:MAG: restriction endonuclease subunit M, partial [Halanaerobiales bacterium]
MPELFNKRIINSYLDNYSIDNYKDKINVINNWKRQLQIIKRLNEKELQAAFLKGIFGKVLGYKGVTEIDENSVEWNLKIEASTEIDASIPDGILGFYNENKKEDKNRVVIELKGPQVSLDEKQYRSDKNYGTPVDQAFSYTSKIDNCQWVVVSNMLEIRLYKMGRSQSYYEVFYLDELDQENNFKKFHMLLSKDNLI